MKKSKHLDKAKLDVILYANLWEDADVLIEGLQIRNDSRVLSIASAGDNCFSLLTKEPEKVVAADLSMVQLFLCELKREAIRKFDRETYMAFIGLRESADRSEQFESLKSQLSEDCIEYWEAQPEIITEGVMHCGKFERYFQKFRNEYFEQAHPLSLIDEMFLPKSEEEQNKWYAEKWHTDAWVELYHHYFSAQMMGSHGREPEFLKHVEGSVAEMMLDQATKHLRTERAQTNYFLYYFFKNTYNEAFLPHYLRKENYEQDKGNLHRLELRHGFIDQLALDEGPFTHFNLSDIFEYMDQETFEKTVNRFVQAAAEGARFAYWNLMVPRQMSAVNGGLDFQRELSIELQEKDLGYFYRSYLIDQKQG